LNYVLDASALIAFLRNEAGAEAVERLLIGAENACQVHAINLCEVYYDFLRSSDEAGADTAIETLTEIGVIIREDMDEAFWKDVARLKAPHRISLADCCCLALARRVGGEVVTSDHREFDPLALLNLCPIQFIR